MRKKRETKEIWMIEQIVKHVVLGCGLRRAELEQLRVGDIYEKTVDGYYETHWLHVAASEQSVEREVPFLEPYLWALAVAKDGRVSDSPLFPVPLPDLDYDQLREEYAFILFFGTLEGVTVIKYPVTFHQVGQRVKEALGLEHLDADIQRWLRYAKRDFLAGLEEV